MNEEANITRNKDVRSEENKLLPAELEQKTSSSSLDMINDDCLRYICKYLNIVEMVNIAETCTRLHRFANDFIYPKAAKEIEIRFLARADEYISWSVNELLSLKSPFEHIGNFVERLSFVASDNSSFNEFFTILDVEKILLLCPNLHTLRFQRVDLNMANPLKHVTSNLKEIKFIDCSGLPFETSDILKIHHQLNSISFVGTYVSLTQPMTISSLTIDNQSVTGEILVRILDINDSLQQLRLIQFSTENEFESITQLIVDKLPKLENLSIVDCLTEKLRNSLSKLPHLKSLKINCLRRSATALLRTLSDCESIENLDINNFRIDDDGNEKPLNFSKLRTLRCSPSSSLILPAFMSLMIKSHMPIINFIFVDNIYTGDEHGILKFFQSKMSVKTMNIQFQTKYMPDFADTIIRSSQLLTGIIEILKADVNRPYLNLQIPSLKIGMEEEKVLNAHRHLLIVNAKTKSMTTIIHVQNCCRYLRMRLQL